MATSSVAYNKPVLPRVSDTSDLASNRASVYSGKALDFDGVNDSISIPSSVTSLNITGNKLSIAGWFVHDGSGSTWQTILYKDTGNNIGYQLFVDGNSKFAFGINTGTFYRFTSTDTVKTNTLYFFTCTYDGATMKIYLNGALDTSNSATGNILSSSSTTFYIGRNNGGSEWFNGRISGIRIWDTDLTATQVAELYKNPEQILPTGVSAVNLKLWLPMMEGAGSYVYNGAAGSLGEELVSNGTVDEVCQKWAFTDNGYLTVTGGKLVWNVPNGSGSTAVQYLDIQANKTYRVTFDYSLNRDGFSVILGNANNASAAVVTGTGTYTIDLTPTSTNGGLFSLNMSAGTGDLTGYMDNISVKEVVPQATGTISGATWVAGVGEPVPQTALIDWNKATNKFLYSEDFTQAAWSLGGLNVYAGQGIAPNGTWTANSFVSTTGSGAHVLYQFVSGPSSGTFTFSAYVKKVTSRYVEIKCVGLSNGWVAAIVDLDTAQVTKTQSNNWTGLTTSVISAGDGWYRLSITGTGNSSTTQLHGGIQYSNSGTATITASYADVIVAGTGLVDYLVWGLQIEESSTASPYLPTFASSQASPVLLPEGLTASKDIFGSDIASPRSAGAFNLDGASWATILNNGSISPTSAVTLEAWVNKTDKTSNTGYHHIISRNSTFSYYYSMFTEVNTGYLSFQGTVSASYKTSGVDVSNGSWNHCVVVYDKSNVLFYINGTLVSTQAMTDALTPNSVDLHIGARPSGIQLHLSQIALPRVYNYALTAEQVADNFNQKASTFGKTKVVGELQAYINRTVAAGATVEAHSALLNTLTELENK
jgi:hypothetical protein